MIGQAGNDNLSAISPIVRRLALGISQDRSRHAAIHGCAGVARRQYRLLDLFSIRHAGRDNHRLPFAGDPCDQRQVDGLKGGNLVGRCTKPAEKLYGRVIEGCREQCDTVLPRPFHERRMPLIGRVGLLVEVVEGVTVPQAATDFEVRTMVVNRQGIRRVGLYFDSVGASPPPRRSAQGRARLPPWLAESSQMMADARARSSALLEVPGVICFAAHRFAADAKTHVAEHAYGCRIARIHIGKSDCEDAFHQCKDRRSAKPVRATVRER